MILAPLAGMMLVVTVAAGPINEADPTVLHLSVSERSAALQPLIQRTTDCIAVHVAADPRYRAATPNSNLGDLIVDAVPACLKAVRAMIDAHERYFGEGTGEAFFMGPYLDVLPTAVAQHMRGSKGASASGRGATAGP